MKSPHLLPALMAILLAVAVLSGGVLYAGAVERRYIHALASQRLELKIQGGALQKEAVGQPDLLLVYGSSEMEKPNEEYSASEIFRTYPTGFAPFVVAKAGLTLLPTAQNAATMGSALHDKKVVISFTPTIFYREMAKEYVYNGNFSRLHGNELAFSTQLSFATKQAAAKRMLEYPDTLEKEPVLRFALERLADGSWFSRLLYYAVWPLGKLRTLVFELQDHWETLLVIWAQPQLNPEVTRQAAVIDWQMLQAKAEREQQANANNNPYGFENEYWLHGYAPEREKTYFGVESFVLKAVEQSAEWTDLDILLRTLHELGAQPLIISRPIHGVYWEAMGITTQARQTYYNKLNEVAERYQTPVIDFRDHDNDKYFNTDQASHTSRKGWVYVDKAMDDFYHGTLR